MSARARSRTAFLSGMAFLAAGGLGMTLIAGLRRSARNETELRNSEQRFRTLAENTHAMIGIVMGQRFVYANRYFAEHSGYSVEELLQLDFPALVHPSFRPMMIDRARRRQLGHSVPEHYEFMMLTKAGEARWVDFSPTQIEYQGQSAIIGTGFDITDRKQAEEALRQSEQRLQTLNQQLEAEIDEQKEMKLALEAAQESAEKARAVAEQANSAKDQFLATLSHELRTPLTPVVAAVSMLAEEHDDAARKEAIEIIHRNVEMEARLIDDLLDVTRIVRGKVELVRRTVRLCDVISRAIEVCRQDFEGRHLHFAFELGDSAPYYINADAVRLQQAFWNLLKNAIKFTPHDGYIGVHCHSDDGFVVTQVIDSGEGIDVGTLPHVFNPFEQGGTRVTRQFGGLGLGLTITKGLIELHGGTIEAFSEGKGRGATFTVRLPVVAHPAAPPATGAASPAAAKAAIPLQILLVEDHGDTAKVMQHLLVRHGHSVVIAGDVATAVASAQSQQFDLLLSDLGLPDGSGADLLVKLHESGRPLPGIALSGYGQEEDLQRSRAAGFSAHLVKPVHPGQLLEAIAAAVVQRAS